MAHNYLYDKCGTRFQLITSGNTEPYNWLFVPGGPGFDSCYLLSLVNQLNISGNVWLVDFPENGDNVSHPIKKDYDFTYWQTCLFHMIKNFENVVYVGHSFGGMYPLLFPEIEQHLKAFIMLSCSPKLWFEDAQRAAQKYNLPDFSEDMIPFMENPNDENFLKALNACLPYYFSEEYMDKGKQLLEGVSYNYLAALWGQNYFREINFDAKWIPNKIPTLVIAGERDCMTPPSVILNDARFARDNIHIKVIQNAGHTPWVEKPYDVTKAIEQFADIMENEVIA